MFGRKFYEPNPTELRRDYYMPNAVASKCYVNYGPSLAPSSQFADEGESNNLSWGSFECPLGPHHHHHHAHYGHHAHHHMDSAMADGAANVNELSATSAHEHVINLYDLYANRSVDYSDCSYGSQQAQRAAESFAYNQEEEYYCCNLEETPISWFDAEAYRSWESHGYEPPMAPNISNQHFVAHHTNPQASIPFGCQTNGIEFNHPYMDNFEPKCELDKFTIPKPSPPCGSLPSGASMFACSSANYYPLKECKNLSQYLPHRPNNAPTGPVLSANGARANLAVAVPLVENKSALSAIQMRSHSTKYKLMSQLGEHITIKEHHHNFTDVYRFDKEGHNFCKAKTLYSQLKHFRIDHLVDPPPPPPPAVTESVAQCHPLLERPSVATDATVDTKPSANLCWICHKKYARPSTLKTHMRTHSGEKPFSCHVCSKAFSQAANLTAHIRTHSGEKPFPCPICKRHFSQSSSVTTHLRTHSGEKPYSCSSCRKSFSDSSTLTKHLRIHSGEKPYECIVCHIKFSQSGNLNRHMRVHYMR